MARFRKLELALTGLLLCMWFVEDVSHSFWHRFLKVIEGVK